MSINRNVNKHKIDKKCFDYFTFLSIKSLTFFTDKDDKIYKNKTKINEKK